MKNQITAILLLTLTLTTNAKAGETCATRQCEQAASIPDLPADVQSFVHRRDGCDHFRGEPWPEGDDPALRQRRDFIIENLESLCTGTDRKLRELRNKYRQNPAISDLLNGYEDRVEIRN